jgi:hypothetical protein
LTGSGKGNAVTPKKAYNQGRAVSSPKRNRLVTGAAGLIGTHLVEQLPGLSQSLVALDNLACGKRSSNDGHVDRSDEASSGGGLMPGAGLVFTIECYKDNLQVA